MITPSQVEAIFFAALEKSTEQERDMYLDSVCGNAPDLRRRVERLLDAHPKVGDFLGRPAVPEVAAVLYAQADIPPSPGGPSDKADVAPARPDDLDESTSAEQHEGEENNLDFLQPSTKDGSLGRLGHYEVLEILGRGGFGVVLKAFDDTLHRVVAIKVMAPQLATTSPARKRFLREARASAAIRDENIVDIYAVEEQPIPFLVMEYIAGETLQQRLNRTGPLDVQEVLPLGRQIASGLAAAHAQGLIHRDIKPSNILLERGCQERVKITDFGLARAADDASLTKSGVIVGTPMYMSPEQAQGEALDQRADLFSLGSVLYVMCSGRPPFRASTTLAVLKRVAEDEPRPIREIIPEVPHWLCDIIARLHAKKPEDRFASAQEIADLLTRCLTEMQQHGTVTCAGTHLLKVGAQNAQPASVPADLHWRPLALVKKQKRMAAALTLVVVTLTVVAIGFWKRGGSDNSTTDPPQAMARSETSQARANQEACAKNLGVAVEFENSIGMKLALIPSGTFMMGSPADEPGQIDNEGPQHEVAITRPFYMGVHDVTVGQFRAFVTEKSYQTEAERRGGALGLFANGVKQDPRMNWKSPNFEQTDDHPVVCVSWNDAKAFCAWLSDKEGKQYALPAEAQWEYACRAGSRTRFSFGDDDQELTHYSWYQANAESRTHPVGQKKPNAWGLYDMHGHVWQWTADWFAPDYYQRSVRNDPPGPIFGTAPVQRGGSWMNADEQTCRSAIRRAPSWAPPSCRGTTIGFRVVLIGDLKSAPGSKRPAASPAKVGKTGFIKRSFRDIDGTEHQYVVFVPHAYTGDVAYPVILFLHGVGEIKGRGSQPVEVGIGPAIKKKETTFPFLTIFPQALRGSWQAGAPDATLALAILDEVHRDYKTDKHRTYLTGISSGGWGSSSLAAAYPDRWAAIAPVSGAGFPKEADKIKNVPYWCFQGEMDTIAPVRRTREMIAALKMAGAEPRYTEYARVGHKCWDLAYTTPELYEFFLAHKKK